MSFLSRPLYVANTKLKEQAGKCLPRCSPRDAQLKSSAIKMTNQSFASILGRKVMSTAKWTAAREICVNTVSGVLLLACTLLTFLR